MTILSQVPEGPVIEVVAGDPVAWTIATAGATPVTSGTVKLFSKPGTQVPTATVNPGVSTSSDDVSVTLTAANTTALRALAGGAHVTMELTWSVSATVNAEGPFEIAAGTLRVVPEGTVRSVPTATSSDHTWTLANGTAITYTVTLGGSGGGASALSGLSDVTITAAADGDVLSHNGTDWVDVTRASLATDTAFSSRYLPLYPTVATVAGTTDTLAAVDHARTNHYTEATLVTVTVPTDASDDLGDGHWTGLVAGGAAGLTLSTTGITVVPTGAKKTIAQGEVLVVMKTPAANTWLVLGGTSA